MPGSSSASRVAFCLLPERRALHGPVTTRRIARLWLAYLGLLSLGLAVSHLADHPTWKVLGLGLMVPGGGFLAHVDIGSLHGAAHLAAAVMAAIAFIAALSLWFATGNALAPPLTWLLLALAAASMDHGEARPASLWAVPLAALGLMAVAGLLALVRRARAAQRRQRANTYLTQAGAQVAASWRGADDAASD